jgi:SAM-dependent methyltransferase
MKIVDPAFNYDKFGHTYSGYRQTDPRIAAYVNTALRNAKTILNVGAGGGSYEPDNRYVVAVEPSSVMREQRKANNKVPAINAKADNLPFDNNAFDASMAMVTVHHWPDIAKGLQELRRVTTGPVIIMSFDPDALNDFWNAQYFPELIAIEKARYPTVDFIMDALGGNTEVIPVPIPLDCTGHNQPGDFCRKKQHSN